MIDPEFYFTLAAA